jgi:Spy/CpxP family protein refolding chaperone
MSRVLFTSGFAACILLAAAFALRADPANPLAQNSPPAPGALTPTGPEGGQGYGMGGLIGVLTDQQRASFRAAMSEMRGKFGELEPKLRAARQDLLVTGVGGKFDENVIRQKALAVSRIEAELTVLRLKALSQMQPPLSPEQIDKIKRGEPGAVHALERPRLERHLHRESPAATNRDENGLPPKR